ncbi:LemA family protein [Parvularcula maris]|uniref:LemA family protein n=1 Tax=Parvularcula maris TaxID=2965077 RepID=A0A9X2L714_9PROT|nr:LemA family protein [Parvularcula maris]MCQ8184136.1 LemA family protein [Parvularcula maris]
MRMVLVVLAAVTLSACGINDVPEKKNNLDASWSEVQNQYQRRADLIPNLVNTVEGFAQQERDVLREVVEARSRASSIQLSADDLTDPAKVQQFQAAQEQLSGALSRLLVTVERYPDLKSNQNFLALQSQLEGTENRIAIARRDYIATVQDYNREFMVLPDRWVAAIFNGSYERAATFEAPAEAQSAPRVEFGRDS